MTGVGGGGFAANAQAEETRWERQKAKLETAPRRARELGGRVVVKVHSALGKRPLPPHFAQRPGKILRPGAISRAGWRPVPLQAWHLISEEVPLVILRRLWRSMRREGWCEVVARAGRSREVCSWRHIFWPDRAAADV
jgi:hypothetical protein